MISYTIETIDNGWTLTTHCKYDDETEGSTTQAFTYKESMEGRENEAKALMELLDTLSDELLGYDKWEKYNVRTKLVKGHKCE